MKIQFANKLDLPSIFWLAQLVCLVAHIGYCSDLITKPLDLSSLQFSILSTESLARLQKLLPLYALANACLSILIFLYLENLWARIVFFILTTSITSLLFMNHPGHNMHLLAWTVFWALFLPKNSFSSPTNQHALERYVRVMQLQILLVYALAGSWKLFYFVKSFFDSNIASGSDFLSYSIAHEFVNSGSVSVFSTQLMAHPRVLTLMSVGALSLQVFSIFVIPFPRFYCVWGILIALFHLGTLAVLNVFFIWPIFLSLIFLTLNQEKKRIDG